MAPVTETVHQLEMLAGTLTERGMGVSLISLAGRVPRLQVAHPAADGDIGDVYASRGRNGNWWFWGRGPSGSPRRATWTPPPPSSRTPSRPAYC